MLEMVGSLYTVSFGESAADCCPAASFTSTITYQVLTELAVQVTEEVEVHGGVWPLGAEMPEGQLEKS
jgi:hypothetical protein